MSGLSGGMRQSGLIRSGKQPTKRTSKVLDDLLDGTSTIENTSPSDSSSADVLYVDINNLRIFQNQPRQIIGDAAVSAMLSSYIESAKAGGTLGPYEPLVAGKQSDGSYLVINGNTRLLAAQKFNQLAESGDSKIPQDLLARRISRLPVRVAVDAIDEFTCFVLALELNERQNPLNDVDKAHAYRKLLAEEAPALGRPMTVEEVCERFQTNRNDVQDHLKVLDLPTKMQNLISEEKLEFRAALAFTGGSQPLPEQEQVALAERGASEGWSVRTAEQKAKERRTELQMVQILPEAAVTSPKQEIALDLGSGDRRGRLITPSTLAGITRQIERLKDSCNKLEPSRIIAYQDTTRKLRDELSVLMIQLEEIMSRYKNKYTKPESERWWGVDD